MAAPDELFRTRLKELRKALKVSQRELVKRLAEVGVHMSHPGISWIETGKRKVSLVEAVAIAAVLDVPLDHLYRDLPFNEYIAMQQDEGPDKTLTPDEAWRRAWIKQRQEEVKPTK